ncbi:hypothetical protein ACJX0J_008774, partial [Zea mays]
ELGYILHKEITTGRKILPKIKPNPNNKRYNLCLLPRDYVPRETLLSKLYIHVTITDHIFSDDLIICFFDIFGSLGNRHKLYRLLQHESNPTMHWYKLFFGIGINYHAIWQHIMYISMHHFTVLHTLSFMLGGGDILCYTSMTSRERENEINKAQFRRGKPNCEGPQHANVRAHANTELGYRLPFQQKMKRFWQQLSTNCLRYKEITLSDFFSEN